MRESWLMVGKWQGKGIIEHTCWKLIRRVQASAGKANRLGLEYQLELNNGVDIKDEKQLVKLLTTNAIHYNVCAIPYNQARDYIKFRRFEKAPLFKSKNER